MTTQQYLRLGGTLAAVGGAFFLGEIPAYRPLAGAIFIGVGALAVHQVVKVRQSASRPDRRMVATQMATTALAFFVLACEYFWPGHHFSSLAMVLIAWPAVVTQWRRRPTASSGTWLW